MSTKKYFFKEDTKSEIAEKNFINLGENWLELLSELAFSDNYTIIPAKISGNDEIQRRFIKHGRELKLERTYSCLDASKSKNPLTLMREATKDLGKFSPSCYSFKPYFGTDTRTRRVSLVDCVYAARLYAMSEQIDGEKIIVKPYEDAAIVRKEGAQIYVKIPSTTSEEEPHEFIFNFVPINKNRKNNNKVTWLKLSSDHVCNYKRFRELKYNFEDSNSSSKTNEFCFHEIAGYLGIIDFFKNGKKKNLIPLNMSPFAIPSLDTALFNVALENNLLIYDETIDSKNGLRKPKIADKEIFNWARVNSLGYNFTFFADKKRDGDLRDYRWR